MKKKKHLNFLLVICSGLKKNRKSCFSGIYSFYIIFWSFHLRPSYVFGTQKWENSAWQLKKFSMSIFVLATAFVALFLFFLFQLQPPNKYPNYAPVYNPPPPPPGRLEEHVIRALTINLPNFNCGRGCHFSSYRCLFSAAPPSPPRQKVPLHNRTISKPCPEQMA